jgi:hypothetical protein
MKKSSSYAAFFCLYNQQITMNGQQTLSIKNAAAQKEKNIFLGKKLRCFFVMTRE